MLGGIDQAYLLVHGRRLLDDLVAESRRNPTAPYVPPAWETGRPPIWLYVSKRLDLVALPNEPLWCSPVLTLGTTAYYRVSPDVLHWLDCAGRVLGTKYEAGQVTRDQVDAYLDAMSAVWVFAAAHLDPGACEYAKGHTPELPDVWMR